MELIRIIDGKQSIGPIRTPGSRADQLLIAWCNQTELSTRTTEVHPEDM